MFKRYKLPTALLSLARACFPADPAPIPAEIPAITEPSTSSEWNSRQWAIEFWCMKASLWPISPSKFREISSYHAPESRADNEIMGSINQGLLLFVGFGKDDSDDSIVPLRDKILNLRVFPNNSGKFDKSIRDINGEVLIVSQFTLYSDCNKGRRPDFTKALHPDQAEPMYDRLVRYFREAHSGIATGEFGAMMTVSLENDGPVTIMIDF